jgi:hypothetical protein
VAAAGVGHAIVVKDAKFKHVAYAESGGGDLRGLARTIIKLVGGDRC